MMQSRVIMFVTLYVIVTESFVTGRMRKSKYVAVQTIKPLCHNWLSGILTKFYHRGFCPILVLTPLVIFMFTYLFHYSYNF